MIGNYPITWLVTELISVILFSACIFHALRQENSKSKLFELLCFIIGAGIFEHAGVVISGLYSYDPHRIMMIGVVPLSTLMIEAVIMYAAMRLFEYFNMPKWSAIWVVGLFSSFMDMSIDPVYVHDTYMFNGVMSGQWNWVSRYSDSFFGIPFFNFSGWLYMTGIYAAMIYLGRWLYKKYNKNAIAVAYPFVCGVLLIIPFSLISMVMVGAGGTRTAELIRLVINYLIPVILMIVYWKKMKPIDLSKDKIIFIVPIVLHLYDLIVGFGLGITESYIPITICAIIHFAFMFVLYRKAKQQNRLT